jgi:hypothetical protein
MTVADDGVGIETALAAGDAGLHKRFCTIRDTVLEKLASRQQAREDTEAGRAHLESVHRLVDRLVPPGKLSRYQPIEKFILLMAVYLHDLGKLSPDAACGTRHHSVLGLEAVVAMHSLLAIEQPEALAVGYVVSGHGPDPIEDLPELKGIYPHGEVRIRYLASLLRLADDLDMCFTRAPRVARSLVEPSEDLSRKWNLRECVDNVQIDPETWLIRVDATPRDASEQSAVLGAVEVINARLREARPYLRATPDVGLYYAVVDTMIDDYWLTQNKAADGVAGSPQNADAVQVDFDVPENAAAVILRYDPVAIREYQTVLAPVLSAMGYKPILVDDLPTAGSLLERTFSVLQQSQLVLADLSDGGAPSVHFRLGVAMGLQRKVLTYSRTGSVIVGDLSGTDAIVYRNDSELGQKLREVLSPP